MHGQAASCRPTAWLVPLDNAIVFTSCGQWPWGEMKCKLYQLVSIHWPLEVFCEKSVFEDFEKFTRKHLRRDHFYGCWNFAKIENFIICFIYMLYQVSFWLYISGFVLPVFFYIYCIFLFTYYLILNLCDFYFHYMCKTVIM